MSYYSNHRHKKNNIHTAQSKVLFSYPFSKKFQEEYT